jgi:hypothetical protein
MVAWRNRFANPRLQAGFAVGELVGQGRRQNGRKSILRFVSEGTAVTLKGAASLNPDGKGNKEWHGSKVSGYVIFERSVM